MLRGQTDSPIAPDGFELSNAWKVCMPCFNYLCATDTDMCVPLDRKEDGLEYRGWQTDTCTYKITGRDWWSRKWFWDR